MRTPGRFLPIIVLLLTIQIAVGQPTEPILRLNTTMHSAVMRRIATDRSERFVLTCSDDKTAKLWDAASGALIKTFRVPINENNDGLLNSCALSADGRIAAVGGWTGYDWDGKDCIYLFDVQTGSLFRRITNLASGAVDIEFSPDGKYMAVGLRGSGGLHMISTTSWEIIKTFPEYTGEPVYSISFDKMGRFVTSCYDGHIRLYDRNFTLIEDKVYNAGTNPFGTAFSPDGSKIAVGYEDSPTLEVLDSETLSLLYTTDNTGSDDDKFSKVTFSRDGRYLYGGAYWKYIDASWVKMIRRWDNGGRGSYMDFPTGVNNTMDFKPFGAEGLLFSGAQPNWGIIQNGEKRVYVEGEVFAFNTSDPSHIKVSYTGTEIGFQPLFKTAMSFSVNDKHIVKTTSTHPGPNTSSGSLSIADWKNNLSPKINGSPVSFLVNGERSQCVDISSAGDRIVWGADWNIYVTDNYGSLVWDVSAQSIPWAVNISGNGKLLVITSGNGTVSWLRMSDGAKLLTLYVHPDYKRWVLWTPSGYYDCSPGAEDLLGWHVNNGKEGTPYFYPASKFRNTYYRPDVIEHVLNTLDEAEALRVANESSNRKATTTVSVTSMLPPVINITSPAFGTEVSSNTLTIKYQVQMSGNEPVTSVKAYIDGRPFDARGFKPSGATGEMTITIPSKDCKVSVIAENRFGYSEPSIVDIKWKGTSNTEANFFKPVLYVLAVGVSEYNLPDLKLNFASKDARDFTNSFAVQKDKLYKDVKVKLITDSEATRINVLDGLDWLQTEVTSKDMAIIYLAGHGINDNAGVFYFLPSDADPGRLKSTCVPFSDIKTTAAAIAGKVILFADACHSGNILGSQRRSVDINGVINELTSAENGVVVFTSSTGKQFSLENSEWGNGAFTKALIEGISGKADLFNKGVISVKTLDAYITDRVKTLTGGQQSPTTIIPASMPDFPIAIK